jgi:hypothetical protein
VGILTDEVKRFVRGQRLGFVATVRPDGTPNLSPKGTTTVWDDNHLIFADLASPGTVANLRENPACEVNVVDPLIRKGYRFKGKGEVLENGQEFEEAKSFYRTKENVTSAIRHIVKIKVESVAPLISPVYASGISEEEVRRRWQDYWKARQKNPSGPEPGPPD